MKMKKTRTILIIDDDERNIFALSAVMRAKEFHIESAIDGKKGIETLKTNPNIDLVLMDIMMPIMDGYEAMRLIRKDKILNGIPIIALTANAMIGDKEKCMQAGASDYCAKPVNIAELMRKIEICLK